MALRNFLKGSRIMSWATDPPVQVGIAAASWSVAGSYARSLLPRAPMQQAVVTGVVAAIHYQLGATSWASLQALAALPGRRPGVRANVVVGAAAVVGGTALSTVTAPRSKDSLVAAAGSAVGRITAFSGLAGAAVSVWDAAAHRSRMPSVVTTMVPAVGTAAAVVGVSLWTRAQRAHQFGLVEPERATVEGRSLSTVAKAAIAGVGAGVGFAALMTGEQLAARTVERGISRAVGAPAGALGALVAHGVILSGMVAGGSAVLAEVSKRVQMRDDVVEPAYPAPPTNEHVSAGPKSQMPFSSLGKEGRRFVLMALTATDIERVMHEPAIDPVRVVGGYEYSSDLEERALATVADMKLLGAFDRRLIVVAAPTGVGYFNYTVAEAIEYLARGDCAIVVPQYALVPSALALTRTAEAEELMRRVLSLIQREFVERGESRTVALVGESLGANVALDIACLPDGQCSTGVFDDLGVHGGLYLGVPFRTRLWKQWRTDPRTVDPGHLLTLVSQPDDVPELPGRMRHLLVVHHDDPVNKYDYSMALQPPWWLGAPAERPPLVPREVKFRPITTFLLATVDLFNGMNSRPGSFVRVGHDYRIDARVGVERAFGLTCTDEQGIAIEDELRRREKQWATRRMVARKLDKARRSIERQLAQWGSGDLQVADLDPDSAQEIAQLGVLSRLSSLSGPPGS